MTVNLLLRENVSPRICHSDEHALCVITATQWNTSADQTSPSNLIAFLPSLKFGLSRSDKHN